MKHLTISEITFITVISSAMGVLWCLYGFIYSALAPLLQVFAIDNLLSGVWLIGGVFFGYIIRRPGSALLGEVVASVVQAFISKWGISSIIYGVIQGLGVEIVFLIFAYKNWSWLSIILASIMTALFGFMLNYFWFGYFKLSLTFNMLEFTSSIISGVIFAGILTKLIVDQLAKTGVLNQYRIAQDQSL